ncbi:MAG: hypothetical protein NTZ67_09485 [Gammaproteobacteria bacterium]|nr:hypothetical protein [Gammaproteobacteria bacterium]
MRALFEIPTAISTATYNWTLGFFRSTTHTNTMNEAKTLNLSPTDYLNNKKYSRHYFENKEFIEEGYTEIRFYNFNFTRSDFQPLLEILNPFFVFIQAEFTIEQICMLLQHDFDLSKSIYRTVSIISLDDYIQLYHFCAEHGKNKFLHGVAVHFNEESDIRPYPDDFVSSCNATSLYDVTVSQAQFNYMFEKKINSSLNLCGIILQDINISYLIDNHRDRITFSTDVFHSTFNKILLSDTSIRNSIINISCLGALAVYPECHDWFKENNLFFLIFYENGLANHCIEISVETFITEAEDNLGLLSARKISPRLHESKNFFSRLKDELVKHNESHKILVFEKMHSGEKLLWLFYYMSICPDSFITMAISLKLSTLENTISKPLLRIEQ